MKNTCVQGGSPVDFLRLEIRHGRPVEDGTEVSDTACCIDETFD
jgi:hypothetical protein